MKLPREERVVMLLPLAMGVTIVSFLLATALAEYRAWGIAGRSTELAAVIAPAIQHASGVRAALRRAQVLIDEQAHRIRVGQDLEDVPARVQRALGELDREWAYFMATDLSPQERLRLADAHEELTASFDRVLVRLRALDSPGAERLLHAESYPVADRIDEDLKSILTRNVGAATSLGETVSRLAVESRLIAVVLDVAAVLLAVVMGLLVVRFTRSYLRERASRILDLERFTDQVSHDIRSPLASVGLALDLARRGTLEGPRLEAVLSRASRTLQRVGQLVDGLLVLARAGGTYAPRSSTSVGDVVTDVLEVLAPLAADRNVELRLERTDPCTVACSPGVLTSIVSNLVGNAVKYMGDTPVRLVTVRVFDLGGEARVEVEDTGPGIPGEIRMRIFEPYFRAAASSVPGLGLGLATVRRMVEAHGGRVGVEPGRLGTRFWFELPTTSDQPGNEAHVHVADRPRSAGNVTDQPEHHRV